MAKTIKQYKNSLSKSVLRNLYRQVKDVDKTTKSCILWLGEPDDISAEREFEILENLKKDGLITNLKTKTETEMFDSEQVGIAKVTFTIKVKNFIEFLKEQSFIPRHFVRLEKTREIVLDDKYLLTKPNFQSENELVFHYLYNRANQPVSRGVLDRIVKEENEDGLHKALRQIVRDLKFTGELRKMFFPNISQNGIEFRNFITESGMTASGVNRSKLNTQLKKLKSYRRKSKK